ncbi:hypothetical protein FOL47_010190 [Perkinsus chesapeaki]|uniref:TLC domain-containing protein n=1 Tax=Perkinsus chesapeaki TaxID=330153 RepID=A0A7J6MQ33_PERCH|nr:hypothetical protein FOL47_010190 [Perkinsus chesapeaki]
MRSLGMGVPGTPLVQPTTLPTQEIVAHFWVPDTSDPWLLLMLLTVAWCILYSVLVCSIGCINSGRRARTPMGRKLAPLTPFLANNLTSLANTILSFTAVSVFAIQLRSDGATISSPRLVAGPLIEHTSIFYIAFAAYCVYDMLWVIFLQPSIDKVMLGHHLLFFAVVWLLYAEEVFPLLAATLLLQEASGPFVCMLHVLREIGITKGKLYTANGVTMTITFGVFRVLLPLLSIIHVFVHWHSSGINNRINWRIILCITLINAGYCLQLYWFGKIIRGLIKHVIDAPSVMSENGEDDLEDAKPFLEDKVRQDRKSSSSSSYNPRLSARSAGDAAAGTG